MKREQWKATKDQWDAPPPPRHGPHGIQPHVEIMQGIEAVSAQLVELQATVDQIRSGGLSASASV
jgi:hypothetical protein